LTELFRQKRNISAVILQKNFQRTFLEFFKIFLGTLVPVGSSCFDFIDGIVVDEL
jgi:hypothetical protein